MIITRRGDVAYVIVGDDKRILIPDLGRFRSGVGRLRGLRCVHTHLHGEPLSKEDLTDLALLGLDLMVCIQTGEEGVPGRISYAHILPENHQNRGWQLTEVPDVGQLNIDFEELIQSLEDEITRLDRRRALTKGEKAVLAAVTTGPSREALESLEELKALAISNNLEVVDVVVQNIKKMNPRFLMGKGRLSELSLRCLQKGSNLLIFDNELTPAQVKSLTDYTELKIIDRSQLILDIFSRRAVTREGKIQVELAQLKYLLPRLATKNSAMSRLTGGIGGRGPGETKLEINRRRARERIAKLNKDLIKIKRQRQERRRLRNSRRLPVISIVGYTNAGKSTLLNTLTHSQVGAGNRLFETLDPSSRRLRFPREREAIITDTVGFIRNLPKSLMEAFAATLEELYDADLLLHVVDAASPRMEVQIKAVEHVLVQLDLKTVPTLLILNKADLLTKDNAASLSKLLDGITISALDQDTLHPLLLKIEDFIWPRNIKKKSQDYYLNFARA
ncbi:GTPase HflX [Thermodesulfobacteriota bacterium]